MNNQSLNSSSPNTHKKNKVRLIVLAGGLLASLLLTVFLFPVAILAQDEPSLSGASGATVEATQQVDDGSASETPDVVTNNRIQQFTEGGLIERQAALSEGLLLMDRQLRQMQLVEQILGAYGPDALVEVAPGQYKTFQDTPAGMRQEILYLDLQIQLSQKRAELEQTKAEQQDASEIPEVMTGGLMDGSKQTELGGDSILANLVLEEVYGQLGNLTAVVRVAGSSATVRNNETLPTGHRVVAVGRDRLTVELAEGGIREYQIR